MNTHTSQNQTLLLSSAYLPNIQYVSKLLSPHDVQIEVCDTYQKQSYRNRTTLLGANGKQDLVIPVKRPEGNHTKTRDIRLDYDMPWNQVHWKAIYSAYRHSPFFDIFEAEMAPLFRKKLSFLLDWNFLLLDSLFQMTATEVHYSRTTEYVPDSPSVLDYRESIHPKPRMQQVDPAFVPVPYFQVFAKKHGFIPNLSFIDLLFNEGPQAIHLCKQSIKKEAV